ncbi:hypothetical protein GCM10010191_16070 [Actinomadura vinacea]|uniref:Inositol monophosphatase n=1 Tax=Actinomadura vinacea TaxID=115336 RepID=A0ABP5VQA8_9ACTN
MSPRTPAAAVDLSAARRVAVRAAEEAGALLRARMDGPLDVRLKDPAGDVVTDLDVAAESLILRRLRESYPGHRVIAEESGVTAGEGDGGDGGLVWLVDPLDGTNNVAIGMPVYAVGLALCAGSVPVLGVVHDPVSGRTWSAIRDEGAQDPSGAPLALNGRIRPGRKENPVFAWTQGHKVGRCDPVAFPLRSMLEASSGRLLQLWAPLVAWVMLARGDIDGIVGYRPEVVDLPAGAILAAEAGAELRALDGSPYEPGIDRSPDELSFVAARPAFLDTLLETTGKASRLAREAGPEGVLRVAW